MSRYCGERVTKPILDAAAHWRDSALTKGTSVFTDEAIWTSEYLAALHRDFVLQPDVGDGVFLAKLRQQLSQTPIAAKKLAAEMMWLLYLCPSSISTKHKRSVIRDVWSWSGEALPDSAWLTDDVLNGIGSGGPGFNQNQWRELGFLVNFAIAFRQLPMDQAKRLLRGLLAISRDDEWQWANAPTFQVDFEQQLRQLHSTLARYGMEFGHRVFYETLRYSALADKAGVNSLERVLDRVVFQKVLPRLHGARRKLETPILALMQYCFELPAVAAADAQLPGLELDARNVGDAKLPISFEKLGRLLRNLRSNQFASFTE